MRSQFPDWRSLAGDLGEPLDQPWRLWLNTALLAGRQRVPAVGERRGAARPGATRLKRGRALGVVFALAFLRGQLGVWQDADRPAARASTGNPAASFFYLLTGLHGAAPAGWAPGAGRSWRAQGMALRPPSCVEPLRCAPGTGTSCSRCGCCCSRWWPARASRSTHLPRLCGIQVNPMAAISPHEPPSAHQGRDRTRRAGAASSADWSSDRAAFKRALGQGDDVDLPAVSDTFIFGSLPHRLHDGAHLHHRRLAEPERGVRAARSAGKTCR